MLLRFLLLMVMTVATPALAQTAGWFFPATSSTTVGATENNKVMSTESVPGTFITVTLPNPATVGAGWQLGFSEANGHGVVLVPPVGKFILAGQKTMTTFSMPSNTNYEYFLIQSDGNNFRLLTATDNTAQFNGVRTAPGGRFWNVLHSSGYSSTLADNGTSINNTPVNAPTTITLPSAPLLPNGWSTNVLPDGNDITIQKNATQGGVLMNPYGVPVSSYTIPATPKGAYALVSFDGGTFRIIQPLPMATPTVLVPPAAQTAARTAIGSNVLVTSGNVSDVQSTFNTNFDNVGSIVTAVDGSNVVNTNAVAGYVHNKMTAIRTGIGAGSGVAIYGQIYSEVNNSSSWGINTVTNDLPGQTGVQLQAGEFDINVNSTATKAEGITVIGRSTAQPSGGFSAFIAASPSIDHIGQVIYTSGSFLSADGAATAGLVLGAQTAPAANIGSQTINFGWYDAAATPHALTVGADNFGDLNVVSNVASAPTALAVFNNVSSTNLTAARFTAATLHGSISMSENELGNNTSSGTIVQGGTGGFSITPGVGGLFLINIGVSPGGKSFLCIDLATGHVYGAVGTPPGTCF